MFKIGRAGDTEAVLAPMLARFARWWAARAVLQAATFLLVAIAVGAGTLTVGSEETRDKILRAFLALAAERGMTAVTTRDIAAAAGVNEVTLFRHFGDKASLARAAVRRFHLAATLDAYDPAIDAATPRRPWPGCRRPCPNRNPSWPAIPSCSSSVSATRPVTPNWPATSRRSRPPPAGCSSGPSSKPPGSCGPRSASTPRCSACSACC